MGLLSARALASLLSDWRGDGLAAYSALADRIRLLIVDGRVVIGTRLPAERDLAAQLAVSRTTVSAAYAELRETGHLHSVRGSGSVARLPRATLVPFDSSGRGLLDFTKAAMPAIPGIADAAAQAARDLPAYLADDGFDFVGVLALREAIAERYRRRGLPTSAEQVMVTVGAQHAISLLARTLLGRGDTALIEAPTYPHAHDALRGTGARLVPVSVTVDGGWDEAAIEQAIQRTSPAMAYLMPDFHNPTGASMPAGMRTRIAALAQQHGTRLVVDETMAEMAIDRDDELLPFAAYGDAISVGSVGKTMWGGLRIGWIRAEPALIQKLVRNRPANDLGTPIVEQLIVARLLEDFDGILSLRRQQLREGRDYVVAALRRAFPEWLVPEPAGGLTCWVNLGAPVSSQLTVAARNHGLVITSGPRFGLDGSFERFLRVPFSYPRDSTDAAIAALSAAWASISHAPTEQPEFLGMVV